MKPHGSDPYQAFAEENLGGRVVRVARLDVLAERESFDLERLPYCIRVLLENALRNAGNGFVEQADVGRLAAWSASSPAQDEINFFPGRVLLQDFTGVPAIVDLAALRDAVAERGGDPEVVNPLIPVDLVIDHSVQVDYFGSDDAYERNVELEMQRNVERYTLLRWAQQAFRNLRVVPPGSGIVHQVNLEYLASVVMLTETEDGAWAYPDTVVGTDSHTTMVNGLGVLGWGVGGIEAEAVMLGQPYAMLTPEVVGVRLVGHLHPETTATDAVLTITEFLRRVGVVGRLVEFFGPGLGDLDLTERATIANMAPEYGATSGFFPVDQLTLDYLRQLGRSEEQVRLVEDYSRLQHLFREPGSAEPDYSQVVEVDLGSVKPSLAGPRRPQDRIELKDLKQSFEQALPALAGAAGRADKTVCSAEVCLVGASEESLEVLEAEGGPPENGEERSAYDSGSPQAEAGGNGGSSEPALRLREEEWVTLQDGSVVIAAITSCTNTSNPAVLIGAGLLARNAVKQGLQSASWVKTSLAPGSRLVTDYLAKAGLLPYLEALGFHVVGYGCTTCIGNSGPLPEKIAAAIGQENLVAAAVLSGNRNFEGRVHALVRANYLASPLLVVAFALAGRVDVDLEHEPLGRSRSGDAVYLRDIWPSREEIKALVGEALTAEMSRSRYASILEGPKPWRALEVPEGSLYDWQESSTYVQEPPFLKGEAGAAPAAVADGEIAGARILGIFGDSITTDHISPAGAIQSDSVAGRYLEERGVSPQDFNTFGARRGNHEIMLRGTFANSRIRNRMLEREGGWTIHQPSGDVVSVYEAAVRYAEEETPLVVIAGKEYGTGSSRDWAAKGPLLLGVQAIIAESYERIHRNNLVGMGILPFQFVEGQSAETLGLTGNEVLDIQGLEQLSPGEMAEVRVQPADGREGFSFPVLLRLDSPVDIDYYRQGGILPRVLAVLTAD